MSSGSRLQSLYNELFGADDQDDASHVTSDACQPDLHMRAAIATRPVISNEPSGLHLFKRFVSQQQQVRVSALVLHFLRTRPPLCVHDAGSSPDMH